MTDDELHEMAREWLVRVQGYARAEHEKSLAVLLRRAYNEGLQRAATIIANEPGSDAQVCSIERKIHAAIRDMAD